MPSIVWKGQLTFGLVSIPVKLYRAARRERVRLHYVHRQEAAEAGDESEVEPTEPPVRMARAATGSFPRHMEEEPEPESEGESEGEIETRTTISRVGQALMTSSGQLPVSRAEVLRGYEVEPDRYVVFQNQELRQLRRKTSATMEIVRSVRLSEIDPVFLETSYYVTPDKGGEKAYAILFEGLRETGHIALARVGMYGREHVVIVRPGKHGLLAHTMFYVDEIRSESEFRADVESVGAKELELAKTFLQALEAPFGPEEFKDTYRDELEAMITKKVAQEKTAPTRKAAEAPAPVVDILEALKKSIAMKRKPAASETEAAGKARGQVTEMQGKRARRKAK